MYGDSTGGMTEDGFREAGMDGQTDGLTKLELYP